MGHAIRVRQWTSAVCSGCVILGRRAARGAGGGRRDTGAAPAAGPRAAASRPARMSPGHARGRTSVHRESGRLAAMRARALALLLYPVAASAWPASSCGPYDDPGPLDRRAGPRTADAFVSAVPARDPGEPLARAGGRHPAPVIRGVLFREWCGHQQEVTLVPEGPSWARGSTAGDSRPSCPRSESCSRSPSHSCSCRWP